MAVDAMKLGATDFVRKPMTPDTLRHAVAAALAKRDRTPPSTVPGGQQPASAPPTSAEQQPLPPLEIWTTNGFFVSRVPRNPDTTVQQPAEHRFVVRHGKESDGVEVVVSIDSKAAERIARECKRNLSPAGAF